MAFGIGELSRRSGCHVETIRYYERSGLIPKAARRGRNREYDKRDTDRLRFVRFARSMGFATDDIHLLLRVREGIGSCDDVQAIGMARLADVRSAIVQLTYWQDWLQETLEKCGDVSADDCPVVNAMSDQCKSA